jgi:2-keto-4-pentenoate hydratase/2-oxohepta-3-ene-1,7-dioic acid hydratase in catechol pathway
MRIANVNGRAQLVVEGGGLDVHSASAGRFGPSLPALYEEWDAFRAWAATAPGRAEGPSRHDSDGPRAPAASAAIEPLDPATCGPPSPLPRQVFAVALNYREHAAEAGVAAPNDPLIFPKYVSAFSGPVSEVVLPPGHVDWECELVVVMAHPARQISPAAAWAHVAGLTVGQDLSERILQRSGPVPQFGLAKSHPGFAPTGPVLVTPDEFDDPDDLAIGCEVNGQSMQSARTSHMIFPVAELIAYLSSVVTVLPGDVIFTGTPPGVGAGRTPPVFLAPGDELHSWIEGIGVLRQRFVAASGGER